MTGDELKAARGGMTQAAFAAALGISKRTLIRAEGAADVSPGLASKAAEIIGDDAPPQITAPAKAAPRAKAAPAPAGIDPRRLPQAYDFATAPDHTRGLERFPASNETWKASPMTDARPASPGWQRVPGCCRIVRDNIPAPLPFHAPRWAGWRGVVTQSGAVYDYESGHCVRPMGTGATVQGRARLALQKGDKRKA